MRWPNSGLMIRIGGCGAWCWRRRPASSERTLSSANFRRPPSTTSPPWTTASRLTRGRGTRPQYLADLDRRQRGVLGLSGAPQLRRLRPLEGAGQPQPAEAFLLLRPDERARLQASQQAPINSACGLMCRTAHKTRLMRPTIASRFRRTRFSVHTAAPPESSACGYFQIPRSTTPRAVAGTRNASTAIQSITGMPSWCAPIGSAWPAGSATSVRIRCIHRSIRKSRNGKTCRAISARNISSRRGCSCCPGRTTTSCSRW